ncbi:MAG: hypothetical protein JWN03_8447 [Nocardia sp.]|uniref:hypothetical protein n=1 Tax=Nocardia sp. TaxID=1821 RepID=UPI002632F3BD|nr:hypothetical protein [Nocardia sp.]MCU1648172.1 hypothetical protein [Nocardia sp.]
MDLDDSEFGCTAAPLGLAVRYRRDWRHFAIWCAAVEVSALPAAPLTVLEYLADHPGRPATQAGRVAAINHAHRLTGLRAPGRAEALRQALDEARAARSARWRHAVDLLLPRIPVWGWPGGLAGRRNAALLVLAAAGLSYADIARLTCGDVRIDAETVYFGAQPLAAVSATGDPHRCPSGAVHGWLAVRPALQRYNGHSLLEDALKSRALPRVSADTVAGDQPLFVMLDRHGYAPMPRIDRSGDAPVLPGLSAEAVAAVVNRHLTGDLPKYFIRQQESAKYPLGEITTESAGDLELSPDYYSKGTAARRRDHEILSDIPDLLDDAVARLEALLDRTSDIIRVALASDEGL